MSDTSTPQPVGNNLNDLKSVGDAARGVAQKAGQAGSDAVDQARAVAQEAKSTAASIAGALGDKATSAAASGKDQLADKLEGVAKAVHRSGEELEGDQDWIAQIVERGADELTSLASTLRGKDVRAVINDLSGLARRQPALFVGAAMAAGFALARVGRVAITTPSRGATAAKSTASAGSQPGSVQPGSGQPSSGQPISGSGGVAASPEVTEAIREYQ